MLGPDFFNSALDKVNQPTPESPAAAQVSTPQPGVGLLSPTGSLLGVPSQTPAPPITAPLALPGSLPIPHPNLAGVTTAKLEDIPETHWDLLDQGAGNAAPWLDTHDQLSKHNISPVDAWSGAEQNERALAGQQSTSQAPGAQNPQPVSLDQQLAGLGLQSQQDNNDYRNTQAHLASLPAGPQLPAYRQPQLTPVAAALGALGAALGGRFAASNVQGLLQGGTDAANANYARAVQSYNEGTDLHQQQVKDLMTQMQIQSGRSETDARLTSEMVGRQMQLDYQHQYQQARIEEQLNNTYKTANSLPEMLKWGGQLGMSPDQIQSDFSTRQSARQLQAMNDWDNHLKGVTDQYGGLSQAQADQLNAQRDALAKNYGIDPAMLPPAESGETERAKEAAQKQANWTSAFGGQERSWALEQARNETAMGDQREALVSARRYLQIAAGRLQFDSSDAAINLYQSQLQGFADAAIRYNAAAIKVNAPIEAKIAEVRQNLAGLDGAQKAPGYDHAQDAALSERRSDWEGQLQFLQSQLTVPEPVPTLPPMPGAPSDPHAPAAPSGLVGPIGKNVDVQQELNHAAQALKSQPGNAAAIKAAFTARTGLQYPGARSAR